MDKLASTAVSLAEVSRDLLNYAARDARDLANAARDHVGDVLYENDPVGSAMTIAHAAAELAQRLESMVREVEPGLGALVVVEGEERRKESGEHIH